ncbi:MAG: ATP-binding protein [Actinomycetes bacterium]
MAQVTLSFTALPEHVRTARLVAASAARRLGVDDEELVDTIRLAVGEACARAVSRSVTADHPGPVEVELAVEPGRLLVLVRDHAGEAPPVAGDSLSMTLVQGLATEVAIDHEPSGTSTLRLAWTVPSQPPAPALE